MEKLEALQTTGRQVLQKHWLSTNLHERCNNTCRTAGDDATKLKSLQQDLATKENEVAQLNYR